MSVAAVLLGVMLAGVINGTVLMVTLGSGSLGGLIFSWMLVSVAGVVVSSPGWVLGSLIVLPIVTHRVRRHGQVRPLIYGLVAAGLGASLMMPTIAFLGTGAGKMTAYLLFSGSVGGLSIATAYRYLVLNSIADDRDARLGAHLG